MKLTAFYLLVICLHASAGGFSQNVTLKAKNMPLKQVFQQLEAQSGFSFVYANKSVRDIPNLDVDMKNVPLQQALEKLLDPLHLSFRVEEKFIIIKAPEKTASSTFNEVIAFLPITGVIRDAEGQSLAGVNVMIKGSNAGVVSDANGNFTLNAAPGDVLLFTFVGYGAKEVKLGSSGKLDPVSLTRVDSKLDEVQIIGYGTTTQRLNTGASGAITSKDIVNQPVSNPILALSGRLAGVQITQTDGSPNALLLVKIRGTNTAFSATAYPLFIVDGVAFPYLPPSSTGSYTNYSPTNPFNSLNPGDIENITILKDADATAVYGSRGANGVVLITTKKGKAGATKLDMDLSTGFSKAARFMPGLLNTSDHLAMRKKAFANDNITPTASNAPDLTVWSQTYDNDIQQQVIGNTAQFSNAQVSVSGGNERIRYLLSGAYNYQTGIYWGDNHDKRGNLHLNVENNSADRKFAMSTSITYSNDDVRNAGGSIVLSNILRTPPNMRVLDSTGAIFKSTALSIETPGSALFRYSTSATDNFVGNSRLSYLLLPNLKASVSIAYTKMNQAGYQAYPSASLDPYYWAPYTSFAYFSNTSNKTLVTEPQLDYTTHIGRGKLQTMVGGTWQQNTTTTNFIEGANFSSEALMMNIAAASTVNTKGSGTVVYKYQSVFVRGNYNWQDKYLLNASFRRDGSSRFGEGDKFGNFWSLGGAWIFSGESFFKNTIPFINFGKLRGGYGLTGNDQIGDYKYLAFYSPNANPYAGSPGVYSTQVSNGAYQWEQTYKTNIGLELGAFDSRLLLTADWYRNKSQHLLTQIGLPGQSGYASYVGNSAAVVQNKGWEFTLSTVNVKGRDFSWSTSLNITLPKNVLYAFPGIEQTSYATSYKVGKSINSIFEYQFAGIDPANGAPLYLRADGKITNGTATGGGPLTFGTDYLYQGNRDPSWFGGMGNTFTYKGLELNVFLQASKSQTSNGVLTWRAGSATGTMLNASEEMLNGVWTAGSSVNATKPPLTTGPYTPGGQFFSTYVTSSANLESNSFVRLKTLSLGWNLPATWLQRIKTRNLQVFAQGQNLLTFTKYKGIDPESLMLLPVLKTVTFGLRISL